MRYLNIKVNGHQRTGTHFVAKLVDLNFMNTGNYLNCYSKTPHEIRKKKLGEIKNRNNAIICVKRNWKDTSLSLFKFRERLGLDVDNYEEFLNRTYSDMWKKGTCRIILHGDGIENDIIKKEENHKEGLAPVSSKFRNIDMKPKEYFEYYYKWWKSAEWRYSNIIIISYDLFISDFKNHMNYLSRFLGCNTTNFKNVKYKVGWEAVN